MLRVIRHTTGRYCSTDCHNTFTTCTYTSCAVQIELSGFYLQGQGQGHASYVLHTGGHISPTGSHRDTGLGLFCSLLMAN